jgi:hypothetical protein
MSFGRTALAWGSVPKPIEGWNSRKYFGDNNLAELIEVVQT